MNDLILKAEALTKFYFDAGAELSVLKEIYLSISRGDRLAVVGPSGSGKSTLLHLLGGLDKPNSGSVRIADKDWYSFTEKERCALRNQKLGFIYQFHHLLPEFSALENVAMPLLLSGLSVAEAYVRAEALLGEVGLSLRIRHKPSELSGGERQRVAIARALVHQPELVLADEPTGNLDKATATHVLDLMLALNRSNQTALLVVTHDLELAHRMDKVLLLQDGVLRPSEA